APPAPADAGPGADVPPAPEPEPETPIYLEDEPAPSQRTLVRSLAALAILFFLGTVAMGIIAASQHRKLSHTTSDRNDTQQVASRMAAALITYDYRHLDRFRAGVEALATGKFKREFEDG